MAQRSDRQDSGRYLQGGAVASYPQRIGWWERKVMPTAVSDVTFVLTPKYSKRPDLLAYDMYGTARLMWFVLQYNTIVDINTEFVTGSSILLPLSSRVFTELLAKEQPLSTTSER